MFKYDSHSRVSAREQLDKVAEKSITQITGLLLGGIFIAVVL
jgi:hypothetical protein